MTPAVIRDFQSIAGRGGAFDASHPEFAGYLRLFGVPPGDTPEFDAVVRPADVESLQKCVRLAGTHGLDIWSTPNATGNGAQIGRPGRPGIVIDLRRMNRILSVDTKSACALVEPGVSYRQLHAHLAKQRVGFWVDSDRDAGNSIAGSLCSRQVGYTPYGDHLLMQCGMEVVLPDGERLRTGMGALPGSDTWQLFKYNFGPYLDGLFTQSTLALPVKIGLWLMPAPPVYVPFRVALPDNGSLSQAIEILRPLVIGGVIGNPVTIHGAALDAARYSAPSQAAGSDGNIDLAGLAQARDSAAWNLYAALYGSPDNVELLREMVFAALGAIAGATIQSGNDGPDDAVWRDMRTLMGGGIIDEEFNLKGWGGRSVMSLTAAAPMEGTHADRLRAIVAGVASQTGVDTLLAYQLLGRTMLCHVHLVHDPDDRADFDRAVGTGRRLMREFAGAGFSLAGESAALRRAADELTAGTPLAGLVERLRIGLSTGRTHETA